MKIPINTLSALKVYFKNELAPYFDQGELESMYFIVLEHYFKLSKKEVLMAPDQRLSESDLLKIIYCVKDLKESKPLAYVLGEWEFYGLPFYVNEHTLIPRPETEELVDLIIKENNGPLQLMDIGTGSGCIPVSIKKFGLEFMVSAVDISKEAIVIAKNNALKNNVEVDFFEWDILVNKNKKLPQKMDVIVSNPPYIPIQDQKEMHKNVLDYEPHLALFVANNEPLLFYDAISDFALLNLNQQGKLYFEIHEKLGEEVTQLLTSKGYTAVKLIKDINGKNRIVKATLVY